MYTFEIGSRVRLKFEHITGTIFNILEGPKTFDRHAIIAWDATNFGPGQVTVERLGDLTYNL